MDLQKEIEVLRQELEDLAEQKGLSHPEVLQANEVLHKLINKRMKEING